MEALTIIGGIIAAAGAGVGAGIGAKLLPIGLQAHRDLQLWKGSGESQGFQRFTEDEGQALKLARPDGRRRDSSVAGICDSELRHSDGSYTCAWEAQLAPTMLAHDPVVETRCDELARMLSVEKPPGTILQFRFSSGPDPGHAITRHLSAYDGDPLIHPDAARLHAMNVDYYCAATAAGAYRQCVLSVWARVPVRQPGDDTNRGLSAFIPAALRKIRGQGLRSLPKTIRSTWSETADDGVVRRILAEEREAFEKAEKVFRLIERECPLKLKRFSREELWEAVYLGHRQNARGVPILPDAPGLDIRDYLCGETIDGDGCYVMHGTHPAAIVSMFVPPQPVITADALRALTLHPGLTFRHTIVAEFVYLDQRKAAKRLDRRIRQVRRTHIRADGRQRQTPEARAALFDLESVRDHITGSREALIEARFYAVIYSEPARTREELKQSLHNLDRYCEQMVTAM
ncbi:MAG: hypothetical protein ACKVX9_07860, partial [Blastocatellia bacterium]